MNLAEINVHNFQIMFLRNTQRKTNLASKKSEEDCKVKISSSPSWYLAAPLKKRRKNRGETYINVPLSIHAKF